jgi:hypothetical protein
MNVVLVEVRRRSDGKVYPSPWPPSKETADRVKTVVHTLRCRDNLSIRAIQRELLEKHQLRRSLGRIHAILTEYTCSRCRDAAQ